MYWVPIIGTSIVEEYILGKYFRITFVYSCDFH